MRVVLEVYLVGFVCLAAARVVSVAVRRNPDLGLAIKPRSISEIKKNLNFFPISWRAALAFGFTEVNASCGPRWMPWPCK